jgi:hypothetical protein
MRGIGGGAGQQLDSGGSPGRRHWLGPTAGGGEVGGEAHGKTAGKWLGCSAHRRGGGGGVISGEAALQLPGRQLPMRTSNGVRSRTRRRSQRGRKSKGRRLAASPSLGKNRGGRSSVWWGEKWG